MNKVSLLLCAAMIVVITLTSFKGMDGTPQRLSAITEVKIGNQIWMGENLNVDKFRNGDPIPEARTDKEWVAAGDNKQPAWCYYNNDPSNGGKYGKLYNWYAVNDQRGLAPKGWHVPGDLEWTQLTDYLGGEETAGVKMKSESGWIEGGNGTNSSAFSGLPGGARDSDSEVILSFYDVGGYGYWWTSTEDGIDSALQRHMNYGNEGVITGFSSSKKTGKSVRCVKD